MSEEMPMPPPVDGNAQDTEDNVGAETAPSEEIGKVLDLLSQMDAQLDYLQVAEDGKWLDGAKLVPGQETDTSGLDSLKSQNTAVEAFFNLSDGSKAFIGFKYPEGIQHSPSEFVKAVSGSILSDKSLPIKTMLESVGTNVWSEPGAYTQREVDRASVMVVDYWEQLPVETIWHNGEPGISADQLKEGLTKTPELLENTFNPICLEIDYGAPGLWVGLPISVQDGQTHRLDDSKLNAALELIGK